MPRGRRAQVKPENAEATPATVADTPAENGVRRRGRRTKITEPINETAVLIDVVLRGRGTKGATPDVLHSVVSWARSVREEGTAIHSGRSETSRRQRAEISSDRIARYEMNLSLLNGVLKGAIALNVEENGELVFRHVGTPETPVEAEPPVAENGDA